MIRSVINRIGIKIIAYDPLHQCVRSFTHFIKNESEKIPCLGAGLIIMKSLLKIACSTAQIVKLCTFKPHIIVSVCNFSKACLNLHSHIRHRHCRPAVCCAALRFCQLLFSPRLPALHF